MDQLKYWINKGWLITIRCDFHVYTIRAVNKAGMSVKVTATTFEHVAASLDETLSSALLGSFKDA